MPLIQRERFIVVPGLFVVAHDKVWLQSWTKVLRDHAWVTFNDRKSEFEGFSPFRNLNTIKMLKDRYHPFSSLLYSFWDYSVKVITETSVNTGKEHRKGK